MRKKLLTGMMAASILGLMLTGCGDNTEVTKTNETQVEISTQEESEEVAIEPIEEATEQPTEEVQSDFLTENGFTITPNGSVTLPIAKYHSDEIIDLPVTTSVNTEESSEEGYSDTTFTAVVDYTGFESEGCSYGLTAFDRYTGVDFEGNHTHLEGDDTTHTDVCVFDVDGKQYDCALDASQSNDGSKVTVTCTIHHPSDYDGVVFAFGSYTSTQDSIYNSIDFSKAFKITDYSGVFVDNQHFFTAADK